MKKQRVHFLLFVLVVAGILCAGTIVSTGVAVAMGDSRNMERTVPDDKVIAENVFAELQTHTDLALQPISVTTVQGTVILSGTVRTFKERDMAEQYSRRVPGVKKVLNNLETIEFYNILTSRDS